MHRKILFERRGAEVLVHLVEAVEHGAEILRADGEHGREADSGIHRVAPADPVPKLEHVGGIDAELRHLFRIRRDGDKMPRHGLLIASQSGQRPGTGGLRVGHRFERGEGFGGDDEQCFRGIQIANGLGKVSAIDVGDKAEGHVALAVVRSAS